MIDFLMIVAFVAVSVGILAMLGRLMAKGVEL